MKYKSESLAVEAFIRNMPSTWHIQRIETSTTSGVPDLSIAIPRRSHNSEFWMEVKNGPKAEIRAFQQAWWFRRVRAGGKIWLMWMDGKQGRLFKIDNDFFKLVEQADKLSLSALQPFLEFKEWFILQRHLEYYT